MMYSLLGLRNMLVLTLLICFNVGAVWSGSSLNFVAIGDWGVPLAAQESMYFGYIAEKLESQFTLALGDNFYDKGVSSTSDPQWQATYEDVYTARSLQSRWYVVAGNHDHYGDVEAEVEYTKQSSRWYMPNLYYDEVMQLPGGSGSVHFIFTDSYSLVGDGNQLPDRTQLQWIESALSNSTSQWKLVIGHYPILSVGEHGTNKFLDDYLRPLLEKYGVAAYISGHDHGQQHLMENSVHYLVFGNGAKSEAQDHHAVDSGVLQWRWPASDSDQDMCQRMTNKECYGFGFISMTPQALTASYYSLNVGNVNYRVTIPLPSAPF